MSTGRIVASAVAVGTGIVAGLTAAPSWAAAGTKLCVPNKEGAGLVTPKRGKCKRGYKLTSLGAEGKEGKQGKPGAEGRPGAEGKTGPEGKAGTSGFTSGELETLKGVLPCIKSVKAGIGGKPTVQFSGCNVQIVNGEGKTQSTNGEGNLVIGYDESPLEQTGSHNLVLGVEQRFTSYGGIDAGLGNEIRAPFASVSGGSNNTASGELSSVSGGVLNTASGERSSVSGGSENTANNRESSVSGGGGNAASGEGASVSGGVGNAASGEQSSVSGGVINVASGELASVSGGDANTAKGNYSSIFGGHLLEATAEFEAIP